MNNKDVLVKQYADKLPYNPTTSQQLVFYILSPTILILACYESLKPGQICRRWVIRQNIIRSNMAVDGRAWRLALLERNLLRPRLRVRLGQFWLGQFRLSQVSFVRLGQFRKVILEKGGVGGEAPPKRGAGGQSPQFS